MSRGMDQSTSKEFRGANSYSQRPLTCYAPHALIQCWEHNTINRTGEPSTPIELTWGQGRTNHQGIEPASNSVKV